MATQFREAVEVGLGVKVRLMAVEPRAAEEWLKKNCENNRRVVWSRVKQYAADMRAGKWRLSDQAVSFNAEGRLVNGQHRLLACIEAGCEFVTLVVFGLPADSMFTLDGGKKRTTDDNAGITGMEWPRGAGATVRRLFMGAERRFGRSYTDQEVAEFLDDKVKLAAVRFAHARLPRGRVCSAPVRAVVARAYLCKGVDRVRLDGFANVLMTGLMEKGDEAAVMLRNLIYEGDVGAGASRSALYGQAEAALKAFLAGSKPAKLSPAREELFPIPGEGYWDEEV